MAAQTKAFRSAIHAQFGRFFADHSGGSVTVHLYGNDVVVPIPAAIDPDMEAPLSKMQEAIIEALQRHVGDPILGDDLAEMAGYEGTGGGWKRAVADLVMRGYIENCRPGYRLRTESIG